MFDDEFIAELDGIKKNPRAVFEEFISRKDVSPEEMDDMFTQ